MYRVILEQRDKIRKEINMLNKARETKSHNDINEKIIELKQKYNYYNKLLKVLK